jgi:hypothetical protein
MIRQKLHDTLQAIGEDWLADEHQAREAGEQTYVTENAGIVGHFTLKLAQLIKPSESVLMDAAIDKM